MRWLVLITLVLGGCSSTGRRCEAVCTEFMTTCGWTAWPSVDVCKSGCEDDLYRRSDATEVLDCYEAAVAPLSEEEAEALVTRALTEGIFTAQEDAGTFSYIGEVQRTVDASTCDLFATVQCKVQATQQPADAPLLPDAR
jgi:hypothetical protein